LPSKENGKLPGLGIRSRNLWDGRVSKAIEEKDRWGKGKRKRG